MAVQWDASWQGRARRATVQDAFDRITRMLTRATLSLGAARRGDAAARAIYVEHFERGLADAAALNDAVYARVRRVITSMFNRVTVDGEDITLTYVPDQATFTGITNSHEDVTTIVAFAARGRPQPQDAIRIYICPGFFDEEIVTFIASRADQRSGTSSLVHELSHAVDDTQDHAYIDDAGYAGLSSLQRSDNADSYAFYCQAFDML